MELFGYELEEKLKKNNFMVNNKIHRASEIIWNAIKNEKATDKIDSGKYAELNVHPSGDYFFKLPEDLRNKIPTYIKENINLERFINA